MIDIQSEKTVSRFAIARCGVTNLRYPMVMADGDDHVQTVSADWTFGVHIPRDKRGTHMSRFIEMLEENRDRPLGLDRHFALARSALERLEADRIEVKTKFKWFRRVAAPVSGREAMLETDVAFVSRVGGETEEKVLQLSLMAKALCPCSKAISKYGAHNQRSLITAELHMAQDAEVPRLEKLAKRLEEGASSPVYPLLKREDEKYVTEKAYENPTFVEDIVRRVAENLFDLPAVKRFAVEALNQESIHAHDCFARVEYER